MSSVLDVFFSKEFENRINEEMMYYSNVFKFEEVLHYINELIDTPLESFIDYLVKNYKVPYLEPSDVFQFSNLDDSTKKVCLVIKEAGDKGYTALEVGKLLENDGVERDNRAYLKYGENQAKTGNQLGLLTRISNKFFLSCIGFVLNELEYEKQELLIRRLMLRNKLVQRLIYKAIVSGKSDYSYETGFLSDSTRLRRKSNVKTVIIYICSTKEIDLSGLLSKIVF